MKLKIFAIVIVAFGLLLSGCSHQPGVSGKSNKPEKVEWDSAPIPEGGMLAIQQALKYPEYAAKAGIQGTVILQTTIDVDGKARDSKVLKGIDGKDDVGLQGAAIQAVESITWKPAMKDEKPVAAQVTIPVKFRLVEDKSKE